MGISLKRNIQNLILRSYQWIICRRPPRVWECTRWSTWTCPAIRHRRRLDRWYRRCEPWPFYGHWGLCGFQFGWYVFPTNSTEDSRWWPMEEIIPHERHSKRISIARVETQGSPCSEPNRMLSERLVWSLSIDAQMEAGILRSLFHSKFALEYRPLTKTRKFQWYDKEQMTKTEVAVNMIFFRQSKYISPSDSLSNSVSSHAKSEATGSILSNLRSADSTTYSRRLEKKKRAKSPWRSTRARVAEGGRFGSAGRHLTTHRQHSFFPRTLSVIKTDTVSIIIFAVPSFRHKLCCCSEKLFLFGFIGAKEQSG